jgi:hypothetical protein
MLLGLAAVLMGYYFWRVTGNPWHMPYQAYQETYDPTPIFLGEAPRPVPPYHHSVFRDFYLTTALSTFDSTRSLYGVVRLQVSRAIDMWTFYLLALFTLPLLMALAVLPRGFSWRQISPSNRFLLMATAFGLAGYTLEVYLMPHYPAPGTCLVFALVLGAMRYVRGWTWREKPVGLAISRAIPLIGGALLLLCAAWGPALRPWQPWPWTWCSPSASMLMLDRARILRKLEQEPGRHLVIVRYSTTHQAGLDWVYSRADIDGSKVIWARDMGREQNAELLRYFQGRRIWLMEPDLTPPRLSAYPTD